MIVSPARQLANKANAQKSTGPKTPEGKAISRANSFKHGLSGAGVVLPHEDAAEIARRFDGLRDQFNPATPMGQILVHRVAFLSVRLERAAQQEAAHLGEKIRHARGDHDEQRMLAVEGLLASLADQPRASLRNLLRTPEGTDAIIEAWGHLREDLVRADARSWTLAHCERANLLTGRRKGDIPITRVTELSEAIWGNFALLRDDDGAGLEAEARQAWARDRLVALIDEELGDLQDCRDGLDLEAFERDREEAPGRALFDASKPASLARRYEATAERGMFRALNELRKVEAEAAKNPPSPRPYHVTPLASSGIGSEPRPEPADEPEVEVEDVPRMVRVPRLSALNHPTRDEFEGEMTFQGGREGVAPQLATTK